MNTPVYREMVRLLNNKMNVSRNTVYNWFRKGPYHLKKVLPVQYRSLELCSLATNGTQELTC